MLRKNRVLTNFLHQLSWTGCVVHCGRVLAGLCGAKFVVHTGDLSRTATGQHGMIVRFSFRVSAQMREQELLTSLILPKAFGTTNQGSPSRMSNQG